MTSRCGADGAPGHLWRRTQPEAVQWSVDSRGVPEKQCLRKDQPHGWVETVGAGARSQSASGCCSGGVSAVISASDLDAVTLRRFCWLAYPCKGALPSDGKGPKVRAACLMPSPLKSLALQRAIAIGLGLLLAQRCHFLACSRAMPNRSGVAFGIAMPICVALSGNGNVY